MLLALVIATPVAADDAAPKSSPRIPASLARKIVDGYGGGAALARVRAVRQRGTVTAVQGGRTGALERLLAVPDSLRVHIRYPDGVEELRIHHAGKGSREGHDVTGTIPHFAMILQAARIALPLWIAEGDREIRYAGRRERESRELETILVPLPGGLELTAEVDPGSGRIVRTLGRIPGPGGQQVEFVNTYSDFRTVSGVAFAHREENYARGVHTGDTVLERIDVLDSAPEGAFDAPSPPKGSGSGTQL